MTRCRRRYTTPDGVQHVNGSVANSNFRIVQERLPERIAQQRCALICRATSSGVLGRIHVDLLKVSLVSRRRVDVDDRPPGGPIQLLERRIQALDDGVLPVSLGLRRLRRRSLVRQLDLLHRAPWNLETHTGTNCSTRCGRTASAKRTTSLELAPAASAASIASPKARATWSGFSSASNSCMRRFCRISAARAGLPPRYSTKTSSTFRRIFAAWAPVFDALVETTTVVVDSVVDSLGRDTTHHVGNTTGGNVQTIQESNKSR